MALASRAEQTSPQTSGSPTPYTYRTGLGANGAPVLAGDGKPLVASEQSISAPPTPGYIGGMTPLEKQGNEEALKEFNTDGKKSFEAAQNAQMLTDQLGHGFDYLAKMNLTGTPLDKFLTSGAFAPQRENLAKMGNFIANQTGQPAPFNGQTVAKMEEMVKDTQQIRV